VQVKPIQSWPVTKVTADFYVNVPDTSRAGALNPSVGCGGAGRRVCAVKVQGESESIMCMDLVMLPATYAVVCLSRSLHSPEAAAYKETSDDCIVEARF
jgi:hypothetical protein